MTILLIIYACLLGCFIPNYFFEKADKKRYKELYETDEEVLLVLISSKKIDYKTYYLVRERIEKCKGVRK